MWRRVGLAVACAGLAACSGPASPPAAEPSVSASPTVASTSNAGPLTSNAGPLTSFADCAAFTARMRELASAARDRSPYGSGAAYSDRVQTSDDPVRVSGPAPAGPSPDGAAAQSAFDTPSMMKTNGSLVVVKSDQKLLITDFSGSVPMKLGQLSGPGLYGGGQLLLAGDRALVLVSNGNPAQTVLTLVDLHDPKRPTILQQETIHGEYLAAARSGGLIRVAVRTAPDENVMANRATATAADWLPSREVRDATGATTSSGPLLDCEQVRRLPADSGAAILTILTIDPSHNDALSAGIPLGIATGTDNVLFSPNRLLVATNGATTERRTRIDAFDVSGPFTADLGSGEVDGYIDSPGAMSPRAGVVRVITSSVPPGSNEGATATHAVTVLTERPGGVVATARTPIATAPRVLGVIRWFDDLLAVAPRPVTPMSNPMSPAYDPNKGSGPLRLVDLSNPAAPRDHGSVDFPDGEARLVPLGAGRLAAIGTSPAAPAIQDQAEVATFDVTDPSAPRRLDGFGLGAGDLFGENVVAWPGRHLLVVPGRVRVNSLCAAAQRCAAPTAAVCDQLGGCVDSSPADGTREADGAVLLTVAEDGTLSVAGWVTGHRGLGQWLRVGDRFAARSLVGVSMVTTDRQVLGTVPIRKASQP